MKIPSVSNSNYVSNINRNLNQNPINSEVTPKAPTVSFGGLGAKAAGKVQGRLNKVFKEISKASFFVEFLIVDTISMILPRIWVGLNRDKDKTGHYNVKAAKEEAGREILSGPSMNIIPMVFLAAATKMCPSVKMDRETLNGLSDNFKKVVADTVNPQDFSNKTKMNTELAGKIFDEAYGSTLHSSHSEKLPEYRKSFIDKLLKATEETPVSKIAKKLLGKPDKFGDASTEFSKYVSDLNHMSEKLPQDMSKIKIDKHSLGAKDLFKDFRGYSDDIVSKFVKNSEGKNVASGVVTDVVASLKKSATDFLSSKTANRQFLKSVTAFSAFMAVGSFLLVLPKLYQQKGLSPAEESARLASLAAAKEANEGGKNENI